MDRIPVFLGVHNRPCLVVGGGKVAERKVDSLLNAGAALTLVSPEITAEMDIIISGQNVQHHARPFADSDIDGQFLVVAATNNSPPSFQQLSPFLPHNTPTPQFKMDSITLNAFPP